MGYIAKCGLITSKGMPPLCRQQDYKPLHLLFLTDLALWCHSMTWLCSPLPMGPEGFFNSPGHREGSSAPQTATTGRRAHGVGVRLAARRQGDREQGRRHEELEEGKGSEVRGALGQGAGGGSGRRQDWDYGDRWHEGIWHGWSQRPEGKTGPLASPRAWRPRSNCSRRQPLYTNSSLMSYSCANMKETS